MIRSSLILVGHFATGKSSVAVALSMNTDIPVIEIGDIVRDQATQSGSKTVLEHASNVILKGDRLTFVTEALVRARKLGDAPYIIVGPRTTVELEFLRTNLTNSFTVALEASEFVRKARWSSRNRVPEFDWEVRDAIERSWGLDNVIYSADRIIDSSPDLDFVINEVEQAWNTHSNNDREAL
jgi:dephospho-CoA kinase